MKGNPGNGFDNQFICPLEELGKSSIDLVGGKGLSLGILAAAGFSVPETFVLIAPAMDHFLEENELQEPEAGAGRRELEEFRKKIMMAPFPSELEKNIREAIRRYPGEDSALAIRSSGTSEDLEGASFAGQYESFLNIRGIEETLKAVKGCWASLWMPHVREYAGHRAVGSNMGMSVIIQHLVFADSAGVAFTVNPVTGDEREGLIEAVFGLGEALVSGRVNADRFVVDMESGQLISSEVFRQAIKVVPCDAGGTGDEDLSPEESEERSLNEARLAELTRIAGEIQEHYGRPMDIEWAYSEDKLVILQARPVTRISFSSGMGEWTTADFRDGGVSSTACSPFMWSLYEYAFGASMPDYFKKLGLIPKDYEAVWIRIFFSRPYWNLVEVKKALERIPGYSEDRFHKDLGVDVDEGYIGKTTPVTVKGLLGALPVLLSLKKTYRECLAHNRSFADSFEEKKKSYDIEPLRIEALEDEEFRISFRKLLEEFYFETETSYFNTIYNTSNAKLDLMPVLDKVNSLAGGSLDQPTLLGGLRNLSHLKPVKDIYRIAEEFSRTGRKLDDETVAAFAGRWRHHGRRELDIRVSRWPDDLPYVREMMEGVIAAYDPEGRPEKLEQELHDRYEKMMEKALRAARFHPLLKLSFRNKVELVRKYAWWREEMRDYSTYIYAIIRNWSLDAGRRLVKAGIFREAEDIWYLKWREATDLLFGRITEEEAKKLVRRGRKMVQSFRNFDNPPEIGMHFHATTEEATLKTGNTLRGTPCSSGRLSGRACIIRRLEEGGRIEKGDILVTRFTDPAWTPLFSRIGGVITETGGVLSHAAVISREYGIPAVLAVPGATTLIRDGERILIDGSQGTVDIHCPGRK